MRKTIFILFGLLLIFIVWFALTLNLLIFALAMVDSTLIVLLILVAIINKIFN